MADPERKYEGSLDGFPFEWDGVSGDGDVEDLAGDSEVENNGIEVDHESFPSPEHVPTLLNPIEEVSEESLSTAATSADSVTPRVQALDHVDASLDAVGADRRRGGMGGKILTRCRKLGLKAPLSIYRQSSSERQSFTTDHPQVRPRNKLRKKTRPTVTITVPGDHISSLSLSMPLGPCPSRASVLSVSATAYPFCRPTRMFSLKKLSWRSTSAIEPIEASNEVQAVAIGLVTELNRNWSWSGSDLRLCRHHRLNAVAL